MTLSNSEVKLCMDLKKTGVVIPAYNAGKTICLLLEELIDNGFDKENIIVVDDGSRDETNKVATGLGLHVVSHKKNLGKGAALKHGLDFAIIKGLKYIVTLDADGQHRVSEMNRFLQFKNHYDLIIGTRRVNLTQMPPLRYMVNRTTSLVISLLSKKYVPDVQSGYRLIDLKIFEKIKLVTNNFQTESELVFRTARNGFNIGFVPITALYNSEKSYISPIIDTLRFIGMAVRFLWR